MNHISNISSALAIFLDGKKRVDKFGPQDGYPQIVGLNILHFLQERLQNGEMDHFRQIVEDCRFQPFDETRTDARTDRSSDILGLLWRKGSMKLYDSEEFADTCDYIYQIDLDQEVLRILGSNTEVFPFQEIRDLTDDAFMERVEHL